MVDVAKEMHSIKGDFVHKIHIVILIFIIFISTLGKPSESQVIIGFCISKIREGQSVPLVVKLKYFVVVLFKSA